VSVVAAGGVVAPQPRSQASYDLSDRVGVVTGGRNGIGAAVVASLRAAGARVCASRHQGTAPGADAWLLPLALPHSTWIDGNHQYSRIKSRRSLFVS
jgi:hypothetical protein